LYIDETNWIKSADGNINTALFVVVVESLLVPFFSLVLKESSLVKFILDINFLFVYNKTYWIYLLLSCEGFFF